MGRGLVASMRRESPAPGIFDHHANRVDSDQGLPTRFETAEEVRILGHALIGLACPNDVTLGEADPYHVDLSPFSNGETEAADRQGVCRRAEDDVCVEAACEIRADLSGDPPITVVVGGQLQAFPLSLQLLIEVDGSSRPARITQHTIVDGQSAALGFEPEGAFQTPARGGGRA